MLYRVTFKIDTEAKTYKEAVEYVKHILNESGCIALELPIPIEHQIPINLQKEDK